MNSAQLQDWLTDLHQNLKGKQRSSRSSEFAAAESRKTLRPLVNNTKLLLNYLICNYEETEAVQPLVSQLLALYYRLGVSRHFVVQVLPSLMYIYLAGLQRSQDSLVSIFETLFVAIYNEEILAEGPGAENFNKRVDQVRIPSIRFPSVYHDPSKLNTFPDIPEFGQNSNSAILCSVQIGPYPAVESLIGENRYVVLTRLIKLVGSCLPHLALDVVCPPFCEMVSNVAKAGFIFTESGLRREVLDALLVEEAFPDLSKKPRIFAPSYFYIEALTIINFCVFNGFANPGLRALDAVHQRAVYDVSADVLLVSNAMRDLLVQEDTVHIIREVEEKNLAHTLGGQVRMNGD